VQIGRKEHLQRIIGYVAPDNIVMKCVSQEAGFDLHFDRSANEWFAELKL
jgi:hypothetical protein